MPATFVLTESPRIRYATGTMMYFAQGIPQGLLSITIPAWLSSQGVSAGDIGSYLAVIVLPWAFKLVTGPFMDRFQFRPMGKRRPWVLGAQLGLSLSLLSLMLIENPSEQIGLLMLIGVLINSFAATQDAAVDGMSIDLTPVREQGRLNAFMSFGKAVGWGVTAAVSGFLLMNFGMQVTAIVAATVSAIIALAFSAVLEREGERKLPWTAGKAATQRRQPGSFGAVFSGVNKVLWTRTSVVVLFIMLVDGLISGFGHALMPIAAVKLFGYTTQQWSQLVAMMGLIGAVVALSLGPLIDRIGAKRILILTITLVGIHAILIAQTQSMWQDTTYIRVMLSFWVLMSPVVMVCITALGMAICSSRNSATQFAIYMSVASLGHSAGSKIYGMIAERSSYGDTYMMLGLLVVIMIVILYFHRHAHERGGEPGHERIKTYTIGTGGGGAGVFFSGAMRCPKCRCDMQQVEVDDTIIDRCTSCNGIWFDEGEVEVLGNHEAAAAIDTGKAAVGKQHNVIDHYRCPRCGGHMDKKVDPQQQHIWYETCLDCNGSFFDAGEFRDLAQVTISDFFKRLVTPKRE
ncbi:MAG: MFS transporter [Xanthomonadales bacterium]|nr:MFS transporter [Xanthomonadales bacterium]